MASLTPTWSLNIPKECNLRVCQRAPAGVRLHFGNPDARARLTSSHRSSKFDYAQNLAGMAHGPMPILCCQRVILIECLVGTFALGSTKGWLQYKRKQPSEIAPFARSDGRCIPQRS